MLAEAQRVVVANDKVYFHGVVQRDINLDTHRWYAEIKLEESEGYTAFKQDVQDSWKAGKAIWLDVSSNQKVWAVCLYSTSFDQTSIIVVGIL